MPTRLLMASWKGSFFKAKEVQLQNENLLLLP